MMWMLKTKPVSELHLNQWTLSLWSEIVEHSPGLNVRSMVGLMNRLRHPLDALEKLLLAFGHNRLQSNGPSRWQVSSSRWRWS